MWDYLVADKDKNIVAVIENKTAQAKNRTKLWSKDGKNVVPANYTLQASLYAYLLKVNRFTIISSFLNPEDYDNPQDYKPNKDNTVIHNFKLDRDVVSFEEFYIKPALNWHKKYIV